MHNVVCSCSECQIARSTLRPGETAKGLDDVADAERDLRSTMTNAAEGFVLQDDLMVKMTEQLAELQLRYTDLSDRMVQVLARLGRLEGQVMARLERLEAR